MTEEHKKQIEHAATMLNFALGTFKRAQGDLFKARMACEKADRELKDARAEMERVCLKLN